MATAAAAGVCIRATGVYGLGAFATSLIQSGTVVGYYEGERPTSAEMEARYWGTSAEKEAVLGTAMAYFFISFFNVCARMCTM